MKAQLKRIVPAATRNRLRRLQNEAKYAWASLRLACSGDRLMTRRLLSFYELKMVHDWSLPSATGRELPHFVDHRGDYFKIGFDVEARDPAPLSRGFFTYDVIRPGDRVLDIGCGDGFYSMRFCSAIASSVDAIDVETSAIEAARRLNPSRNVNYYLLDAVRDPFPGDAYDVVIWDGAMGHFSADVTVHVLNKIAKVLGPQGVFVGSESLGREGHDHLQYFHQLDDLCGLFNPIFAHLRLRERQYYINNNSLLRREAYWRCSASAERLDRCDWINPTHDSAEVVRGS